MRHADKVLDQVQGGESYSDLGESLRRRGTEMGLEDIQFWVQERHGGRSSEIKGNTFNKRWRQEEMEKGRAKTIGVCVFGR